MNLFGKIGQGQGIKKEDRVFNNVVEMMGIKVGDKLIKKIMSNGAG